MTYDAAANRYDDMEYRYCGRSGLKLPALALGLWQNFGDDRSEETQRAILQRAFDRGVTHFDLANNYGPPYGRAEENFGRYLADDFAAYRDELVISTKAGWDMWPGPYGQGGGSRKYVLASLDQSLRRMGLDYVDIFYSHRFDPETPVEETMMALDRAVRSGKALYAGISSYSPSKTAEAAAIARDLGTPLLIHQPSYSMLNRWIEGDLLDEVEKQGMGCIVFTALAQGLLTDRYLDGVPADSRAAREDSTVAGLDDDVLRRVRALNAIAKDRGQQLAQLALQWAIRDPRVTSAVIGASSVEQLDTNLDALSGPALTAEELAEIDKYAVEAGVNLWAEQTEDLSLATGEHYFSADPSVPFTRSPVTVTAWGRTLSLQSGSGVFARGRVDIGTSVLLRSVDPPSGARTVLDLGCGYGVIGLAVAAAVPSCRVTGVDVNERALLLANENAVGVGLDERFTAVLPSGVAAGTAYDEIWSNPPIRIGKQALHELLLGWLPRLVPGGRAVLVVGKNLGADSLAGWLGEQGYPSAKLASAKGFRVLEVRRTP